MEEEKEEINSNEIEQSNNETEEEREESESVDDIKNALKNALYENSMLKERLTRAEKERDEASNAFLRSSRETETSKQRDYASIIGDIK